MTDLRSVIALLAWDRDTYMPPGGLADRGRQLATLERRYHELATSPQLGAWLEQLRQYEQGCSYSSIEASLIRVARVDYQHRQAIPAEFTARLAQHQTLTYGTWVKAKQEKNWTIVQPYLEKMLDLSLEFASFFPRAAHPADPAIARRDPDMTVAMLRPIFQQLRDQLVPIMEQLIAPITDANQLNFDGHFGNQAMPNPILKIAGLYYPQPTSDQLLQTAFNTQQQYKFCRKTIERIGYDFQRGRIDTTAHPFTSSFGLGDVRITHRTEPHNLAEGIFSTLHEMGHALYEQGFDPSLAGTPLANGTSSGMHEAQARLWENFIGRSRAFWECCFPWLQGTFLRQLGKVSVREFYDAINVVSRSPIRVQADEVTYNLHVIIRFELELAMLEGKLSIADLPEAWNDAYQKYLGISPRNPSEGVLQDVHWFGDRIGGQFQGYALGNLMAAQLYETALRTYPEIPVDIERGRFSTFLVWLQRNIYRYGRKFTATELLERITGTPLQVEPFIRYLKNKYHISN